MGTAGNVTVLPIHSELGAAHTGDDVGAATSLLSTFQQDGAAVLDAEHFWPSTNSSINNSQDPLSNTDRAPLVHIHPTCLGGYSDGMLHQIPSPPIEAAGYAGGHVDVPPRELHESSTAPASVLRDLTGCHPLAGQDMPSNGYTADSRWSGVFGATWDSNLGPGEPFNEEVVDQRWTGSLGPIYNSDLNQGLLSYDQRANQQWSGVFGNGWHSCLNVPMNERSALLADPLALQPVDPVVERI